MSVTSVPLSIQLLLYLIIVRVDSSTTTDESETSTTTDEPETSTPIPDFNAHPNKTEILKQLLSPPYDNKIRPTGFGGSGPVHIAIDVNFRSIENIDDIRMEYAVQIIYRQRWVDPRLDFYKLEDNVNYIQVLDPSKIWAPDVFFDNERRGLLHTLVVPNVFTRIYPNGTVLQSYRFTLLLACPMSLRSYPLDVQVCPFRMASYGYTELDTVLSWSETNPVQSQNFMLPQFNVISFTPYTCTSTTISGNYSCIAVNVKLKRAFGYFLIQIYIPCAMLVMVSWVSFWLQPDNVEARVSLGVTTILTIVTQTYGINKSVPPASYIKALDVWTAICQFLVFGGLLQFALVNYITRSSYAFLLVEKIRSLANSFAEVDDEDVKEVETPSETHEERKQKCMERAKRVDRISRIGFPAVFFLFNIVYWSSYGMLDI